MKINAQAGSTLPGVFFGIGLGLPQDLVEHLIEPLHLLFFRLNRLFSIKI